MILQRLKRILMLGFQIKLDQSVLKLRKKENIMVIGQLITGIIYGYQMMKYLPF